MPREQTYCTSTSARAFAISGPFQRAKPLGGGRSEVILDNLNTHKKNEEWLARHPLVTFHYTPTRASWLNQVEGWFSILQGQSLTGASFTSVEQLKKHIDAFIESYNEDAEPFVWTKSKVHQRRVKGRRLSDL